MFHSRLKMVYDWNKNVIMSDALKQLYNNEFLSDVIFEFSNGQTLYAHTFVLCMRSPEMFEIFKKRIGRTNTIPILDRSFYCMEQFLKYIYTDRCDISAETAIDLFQMSQHFAIDKLEQECCDVIIATTDPCQLLEDSIENNWTDLQMQSIYYISENFETSIKHSDFTDINSQTLNCILKLDAVSDPSEFMLFKLVMSWASRACEKSGVSATSSAKREKLGENFKLIRFAAMSNEEFGACVDYEPNLLAGNEIFAISVNIVNKKSNLHGFSDQKRIKITCENIEECRELNRAIFETTNTTKEININVDDAENKLEEITAIPFSVYLGLKSSFDRINPSQNFFSIIFSVSKPIELTGIYLNNSGKTVQCKIQNATEELLFFVCLTGNRVAFKPIKLEKNIHYTILYKFLNYDHTIQHLDSIFTTPWNVVVPNDVKFTFFQNSPHIEWLFYNFLVPTSANKSSISNSPIKPKSKCLYNTIMANPEDNKSVLYNMFRFTSQDSVFIDSVNNINLNIGYNVPSSVCIRFQELVTQQITNNNIFKITFSVSHVIHLTAINLHGIVEPIKITLIEENNRNWIVPCYNNMDSSAKLIFTPTKLQANKLYSIYGMFYNGGINRLELNTLITRNILSDDGIQFTIYKTCAYIDRLFYHYYK